MTEFNPNHVTRTCECGEEVTGPEKGGGNVNWKLAIHQRNSRKHREWAAGERESGTGEVSPPEEPGPGPSEPGEEVPPSPPRRSLGARLWGEKQDAPKEEAPAEPRRSREVQPTRPKGRRVPTVDFWTRVTAWAGRRVEAIDPPVGRCVQIEAGVAGIIFEDTVRGTPVDRPVQWLIGKESEYTRVAALIGAPVLVGMIERNPNMLPVLGPYLADAFMTLAPDFARAVKQAEKKKAEFAKAMAEMGPMFGKAPGEPVTPEDLIGWLFRPPDVPQEAPAPDGRVPAGA